MHSSSPPQKNQPNLGPKDDERQATVDLMRTMEEQEWPFKSMFEASPLPQSVARKSDGLMLAVNKAWEQLMGRPREEVIGLKTSEFKFWNKAQDRDNYLSNLPNSSDHQLLHLRDGLTHRVRLHTSEVELAGQTCLLVCMSEVTRELAAVQALEVTHRALLQRVELLEASEKLAGLGHWTVSADDTDIQWSAGLYEICGMTRGAPLDRARSRGGIHKDDLEAWMLARESLDLREHEYRWIRPDGTIRWFKTRIGETHLDSGHASAFGVVQDITLERLAKHQLAQQLAFVQNITAHVPAVLFQGNSWPTSHNKRGKISFVNDAVRDILETEPSDLIQDHRRFFQLIHPMDLPELLGQLLQVEKTGEPLNSVIRMNLPTRGLRWCNLLAEFETQPDGSLRWHGFVTDVTESVQAAHALERQHRMLEAVQASQAVFIEAEDKRQAFETLLSAFLSVTSSEYGFIGEVLRDENDQPCLRTHAVSDIAWNKARESRHTQQKNSGMVFRNLNTLFGQALSNEEFVICNDPSNDPRSEGFPVGQQALNAFIGIPIHIAEELVAVVGLANQLEGYTADDVAFLQPLLGTARQLVVAERYRVEQQRTQEELKITGQKLAEKSETLQYTLDSITQGLSRSDANGRFVLYNQRLLEMLDLPEELMASQPRLEEVMQFQTGRGDFGPNLNRVEAHARPHLNDVAKVALPERYLRKTTDGRTLEFRARPLADGSMVRTCADVTPFIEAQEALRAERQRLEWVLEATRPGIWETDLTTERMSISPRWAEMLGYTVDELEPVSFSTWRKQVHPNDLQLAMERHHAHCEGNTPFFECDLRMLHKAGHWVWINSRGRVHQRDKKGTALFMSGTHLDITDRVSAQEEVRALNASLELRVAQRTADLERALKDMEAVSYSIAHDLRAPLRAVNGFAAVIVDEEADALSERASHMFGRIVRSSRNMGQMLTDMLSMLQVVRVELDAVPVDLNALTHTVVESLTEHNQKARIEIQSLPSVSGDAALLRQVISNLLDNALKYSNDRFDPLITIGYSNPKNAFFIQDNGMGFDMAHAGKLFGLFQRIHANSVVPGTGVGLAIVSRIIERHGGTIWAESKPGAGATFWWTLGKRPSPAAPEEAS